MKKPTFNQERSMLIALLNDMPADVLPVDLTKLTHNQKLGLVVTCCINVCIAAIGTAAAHNKAETKRGIEALIEDLKENLGKL